jgi:hypothetical protein
VLLVGTGVVQVKVTRAGRALHGRLLKTVISFNRQLRTGIRAEDEDVLCSLHHRLQENVGE